MLQRADIKTYAHFEHVIAFAIFGALFCFAYPRHIGLVCCVVFGGAVATQFLQTLTQTATAVDWRNGESGRRRRGIILAKAVLAIAQRRRERVH